MASMLFLSGVFWTFLLLGPALGEGLDYSRRTGGDNKTFEEEYPKLPNTTDADNFRQNIIYRLYTKEGDVLRVVNLAHWGGIKAGQLEVATSWAADNELDTTHFTFLTFGTDSSPGLAGIFPEDQKKYGYFRFLQVGDDRLYTVTRTAYNPPVCITFEHHYACPHLSYSHVYPHIINCTSPVEFHLDFEKENGEIGRLYIDENRTAHLAPVSDTSRKFVVFTLRPIVNRAVSVIQNFTYLNSPEDIIAEARDVALGITEVVINHGEATYTHEISHSTGSKHESSIESFITIGGSLTISVEVGGGVKIPAVVDASASVTASVSYEMSGTMTNTQTKGTEEVLTMTQRITVGPGTRLKCSAFFKVIPFATLDFVAVSKVYIFWNTYDKISNNVVPRLAPLSVALVEVARSVKGWDIIGTDGDAVLVKYRGSMTAQHGIASVFSSEPI